MPRIDEDVEQLELFYIPGGNDTITFKTVNSINFLLCGYLHGFKYFVITNNAILYY